MFLKLTKYKFHKMFEFKLNFFRYFIHLKLHFILHQENKYTIQSTNLVKFNSKKYNFLNCICISINLFLIIKIK